MVGAQNDPATRYSICIYLFINVITFLIPSICESGKWHCLENRCPARCVIEGQFVTTIDGKHYAVPGKCTYIASQVILFIFSDVMWFYLTLFFMMFTAVTYFLGFQLDSNHQVFRNAFYRNGYFSSISGTTELSNPCQMSVMHDKCATFFLFTGRVHILTQHGENRRGRDHWTSHVR